MPSLKSDTIQRSYFTSTEVAKALSVSYSCLHYWERVFTATDCGRFALVARLLKFMHIPAAKLLIDSGRAESVLDILEPQVSEPVGVPMQIYS